MTREDHPNVFLYVPNIIGYIRVVLLLISWLFIYHEPNISIVFYIFSASLDALDGYAARKLNQTSSFGAFLDVLIDVVGRGVLWCRVYRWGYLVSCLEWLCFVCTHNSGAEWRSNMQDPPWFVAQVMRNGYKSPLGVFVIAGLHGLPVWLYAHYAEVLSGLLSLPLSVQILGIVLLSAGRALGMFVEIWFVYSHILRLAQHDSEKA